MKSIKIVNNDFVLTGGRHETVESKEALKQNLLNRIKLWLGEFEIESNSGIDYINLLNQDNLLDERFRIAVRNSILAESHILKINKLETSFDKSTREYSVEFSVESELGLITGVI